MYLISVDYEEFTLNDYCGVAVFDEKQVEVFRSCRDIFEKKENFLLDLRDCHRYIENLNSGCEIFYSSSIDNLKADLKDVLISDFDEFSEIWAKKLLLNEKLKLLVFLAVQN